MEIAAVSDQIVNIKFERDCVPRTTRFLTFTWQTMTIRIIFVKLLKTTARVLQKEPQFCDSIITSMFF